MKKLITGLFITSIFLLSACSSLYGDGQAPDDATTPEVSSSDATQITVSGNEFSFSPAAITLNAGEKVSLTFKNVGKANHNFSIEGLGISTKTIGPGRTDTLEFTVPAAGEYTFFCSVGGHRDLGMEGPLKAE